MTLISTFRVPAAVLCTAVAMPLLVACSTSATDAGPSLAETKASAQLLRNNAIERINDDFVTGEAQWSDISVACGDADEDPNELLRAWHSMGTMTIKPEYADQAETVMTALAKTYPAYGWTVSGEGNTRVLTKDSSISEITLSVGKGSGKLTIESVGPCVTTGGPNSDEVKALEEAN